MPRVTITAGDVALASIGNDFAQLTYDQPRNGLINGSFEIWQRGTSGLATATSATNGFTADRWQLTRSSYVTGATGSQVAGTSANRYALRIQRTAGNTGLQNILLYQTVETANAEIYAGQQVTFSAWMRKGADFNSSTFTMRILGGTGTDQNVIAGFTGNTTIASVSKTLTTTWQRISVTATIPSTITELAFGWLWTPVGTAGTNDYYEVAGAQVEIGAVPSTFQMNGGSVAAELANCQRYYRRLGGATNNIMVMGGGTGTTTTNFFAPLAPPMRVAPTSVGYASVQMKDATGATTAITGLALVNGSTNSTCIQATHAVNDVAHRLYCLDTTASTGYIELNAEI